ncbi:MAG TPA: hypothetical protein VJG49_01565 [Candidatus Nanoarchaeia archaeon]|nr:hypothetical protein [Candidatus Nanoarchaeia archaeon]
MPLKTELSEKVPANLKKEPEFQALLDQIKQQRIEEKAHLVKFLEQEIALVERWLEENSHSGGAAIKAVRSKIVHLGVLKKSLKLVREFLL